MSLINRETILRQVETYSSPFRRETTAGERFAVEATKGDIYRMIVEAPEVAINKSQEVVSCSSKTCRWRTNHHNYENGCIKYKDISFCNGEEQGIRFR